MVEGRGRERGREKTESVRKRERESVREVTPCSLFALSMFTTRNPGRKSRGKFPKMYPKTIVHGGNTYSLNTY